MRTCPSCGSIWVCWNWVPDWFHECWSCENVFGTPDKVLDGISYDKLTTDYPGKMENE